MPQSPIIHANDSRPGITRRALKRGWAYFDAQRQRITDREEIDRLNAVAMPTAAREAEKYAGCIAFGEALPRLRARIEADLSTRGLRKEKTLAAVVRLLDLAKVRIGNEQYAAAMSIFAVRRCGCAIAPNRAGSMN